MGNGKSAHVPQSKLMHLTFCTFLCELQKILSQRIMDSVILVKQFSEWGAILLHDEVRSTLELYSLFHSFISCNILNVFLQYIMFSLYVFDN